MQWSRHNGRKQRVSFQICCSYLHYRDFMCASWYDDVIKWKHFPRYWSFVRGIHRPPVNSPHKGHWRGALMFSLICARINRWVNNGEASDLRRHRAHYDVIVMTSKIACNSTAAAASCWGWHQINHPSPASLAPCGGNPPTILQGPVMRTVFCNAIFCKVVDHHDVYWHNI